MSAADPFGLVGQVLDGQFRVDKLVGEGGFSAVYRGHHQGLNEPIAIKCLKLPPSLGTSLVDTFVQRFRDESRILYRLSQGNLHVVRSIAAGTTQAPATGALVPYMVLEWLEGRSVQSDFTVRRTVGEKGRTVAEIVKLFETAADGLAYAHAQGVVHRDLNPGNLFLANTQHGVKMKVLDFGVAKLMHDGALNLGPRAHTVGQIKIFAPAYGAPEQFDDRIGAVGAASDVYSFALILLEALRDKNVVEGTHLGEFAQSTCDPQRRPTPRFLGVDVPDEVEQTFVRATTLDPKERWHSAGDFWKSLTVAWQLSIEHKNEQAARDTPSLGLSGSGAAAPSPVKNLARTMPLGANTPGLPPGFPRPGGATGAAPPPAIGATRPRVPTTIGIPAPASGPRTGALPSPNSAPTAPAGARTLAAGSGSVVSGLASTTAAPGGLVPPVAPPRSTARPPPTPRTAMPNMPAMPAPPRSLTPFPPRSGGGTAQRTPSDRPGSGTDRPGAPGAPAAPMTARFPSAAAVPPAGDGPAAFDDDYDQEEATKVHAPTPEVLRTLALHDAATARAAVQAKIAAHQAEQARAANPVDDVGMLEAAARDGAMKPAPGEDRPRRVTPVPPSLGGTLMMSPVAHVPSGANQQNLKSTVAMAMPPTPTPGLGFTPAAAPLAAGPPPPHAAPSGAHGTQGMAVPYGQGSAVIPATHAQFQGGQSQIQGGQSQIQGGQSQIQGGQSQIHGAPSQLPGTQSQIHGAQSQMQGPGAAASFGPGALAAYGRPSTEQPFAAPSIAQPQSQPQLPQSQPQPADGAAPPPAKPLPIVPIAIGLAALALGGIALGFFALRARHQTATDPTAISSSDVPSASGSLTPVPVVPDTPPEPTAAAEVDAAPAVEPEVEDASTTAAADSAVTAASAAASATAPPTAASGGPVFTWPPPSASAAPSAKPVDPNAFSESTARSRLATANGVLSFCKKEGGVTGSGNASITFANDGSVAGVALDPPFAGTKEGDCVAAQFRRAKVSPFTGPPQTVRHGFEVPK